MGNSSKRRSWNEVGKKQRHCSKEVSGKLIDDYDGHHHVRCAKCNDFFDFYQNQITRSRCYKYLHGMRWKNLKKIGWCCIRCCDPPFSNLTPEQKIEKYRANQYQFPPPPVPTSKWTELDWIKYVDFHGKWFTDTSPENQ